jgi:hypothetical protein
VFGSHGSAAMVFELSSWALCNVVRPSRQDMVDGLMNKVSTVPENSDGFAALILTEITTVAGFRDPSGASSQAATRMPLRFAVRKFRGSSEAFVLHL